ncbi:hypothetical protein ACOTJC_29015 [Achromobacter xylosoxidans]|uniref:hypothetical protein n=1 Tax=Alcaligenes xylosoxydans xylosoxydans TaxID=85698 RepID=UPI002E17D6BE|nr:hypothetical protein [Achromobacter xylosoxidans]
MNSPIKLPAIPYELLESLSDGEVPLVRAYAKQAVREALAALKIDERAAFEDWVRMRHPESPSMLWREDEGYVYVNSEWDAWQARASLIPENNHE